MNFGVTEMLSFDRWLHTLEVLRVPHAVTPGYANLCTGAVFSSMLLLGTSSLGEQLKISRWAAVGHRYI